MAPKTTRSTNSKEDETAHVPRKKRATVSATGGADDTNPSPAVAVSPNHRSSENESLQRAADEAPTANEGTQGITDAQLEMLRNPSASSQETNSSSSTGSRFMDKLYTHATKTHEMVAIVRNNTGDNPGFIGPACNTLAMPQVKKVVGISDIYNQVDDTCPTQFKNYEIVIRRDNRHINIPQPVFLFSPKNTANNTRANRVKWGEGLAKYSTKIMQQSYPNSRGVKFHQDMAPVVLAMRPTLSDFLTIADVLEVIKKTYPSLSEDQIKNTDSLMEKYYGSKLQAARRYFHMGSERDNDSSHPPAFDFLKQIDEKDNMGNL